MAKVKVVNWMGGEVSDESIIQLVALSNAYAECTPGDGGPGPTDLYIALCMAVGAHIPHLIEIAARSRGLSE